MWETRRRLRAAEGGERAGGRGGAARPRGGRAGRADLRAARQRVPAAVVGAADRAGRARARARRPGAPRAARRRARPRGVDARPRRAARSRARSTARRPPGAQTMREVLEAAVAATGSGAELVWVPDERLQAAEVEPWTELPLWLPEAGFPGTWEVGTERAQAAGLRCRPIAETVADVWAWLRDGGEAELDEWRSEHRPPPMKWLANKPFWVADATLPRRAGPGRGAWPAREQRRPTQREARCDVFMCCCSLSWRARWSSSRPLRRRGSRPRLSRRTRPRCSGIGPRSACATRAPRTGSCRARTPRRAEAARRPLAAAQQIPPPYTSQPTSTNGKVFFTDDGLNYVCSGTAVLSGNRSTVWTAGHCVHDGASGFHTNWAFVPAYADGSAPVRHVDRALAAHHERLGQQRRLLVRQRRRGGEPQRRAVADRRGRRPQLAFNYARQQNYAVARLPGGAAVQRPAAVGLQLAAGL